MPTENNTSYTADREIYISRLLNAPIELVWDEQGGPIVTEPDHEGFGTKLIALSVTRQMGGEIRREWRPGGLLVRLIIPASAMHRVG